MSVLRTLVVMLIGLLALVAWPTAAQAQTMNLELTAAGAVNGLGSNGAAEAITVSYVVGPPEVYTIAMPTQPGAVITVTNNSGGRLTDAGSGSNVVTVTQAAGTVTSLSFDQGDNGNSYTILSNGDPLTIHNTSISGGQDQIDIGNTAGGTMDGIGAAVTIDFASTTKALLTLNDAGSVVADPAVTISATQVTGMAPGAINYTTAGLATPLTFNGSSGGNTFTVTDTPPTITTTVATGSAIDTVTVQATGAGSILNLNGVSGADTLTLGNAGNAQLLNGTINVTNPGGTTALTVSDVADGTGRSVTIGAGSLTGTLVNNASVTYANLASLQVSGGSGGNTFTVNDTPAVSTTLNAGTGADSINVADTGAALAINAQGGANTITLGATSLNVSTFGGTVNLTTTGGGTTGLFILDSNDTTARTLDVSGVQTTLTPPGLIFDYNIASITGLTVAGGSGGNTVTVPNTRDNITTVIDTGPSPVNPDAVTVQVVATNSTLNINGQSGADTVTLGSAGSAQGLAGIINVSNATGATALIVDDSADGTGRTVTIGAGSLTGTLVNTASVTYANLASLQVNGGGGGNTFTVNNTPAVPTTLNTGGGADAVNAADTGAALTVNGQGGTNTVTLGATDNTITDLDGNVTLTASGGGTTVLNINNQVDATGRTFTVTGTETTLQSPSRMLSYGTAAVSTLTLNVGTGGDLVTVTPAASTAFALNDPLPGPPNDTVNVITTGLSNPSFTGTPANGGFTATGVQPVTYTNFEVRQQDGASSGGTLNLSAATYTVAEGGGNATITVNRTGTTLGTIDVTVTPANGTATSPADFDPTARTITFVEGQTTASALIPIVSDALDEADETVAIALSNPTNGAILGTQTTATLTITDDDGTPSLSVANAQQTESGGTLTFTVTLSPASGQTVTVQYATGGGTATAGASCAAGVDYVSASGTLTFTPGVTSQPVPVTVCGDAADEPDETFTLTLSSPTNATLGTSTATGTITDDDGAPSLSVASVQQAEGAGALTFTVILAPASGLPVTVQYGTGGGTAAAGATCVTGVDYVTASGTLTFNPGETSKPVSVTLCGDTTDEPDETFTLSLSVPTNASIGTGTATGTIQDDDGGTGLSVASAQQAEGNSGTSTLAFTVTLSPASGQTVTVQYATGGGTATGGASCTAGVDYVSAGSTLTFTPGLTSQPVPVTICADTVDENDETFTLSLSNPTNATIGAGAATGTIVDDDGGNGLSVANAQQAEGNSGTSTLAFTVTLSPASGQTVTVQYATSGGTATAGASCATGVDYVNAAGTLTFAPGLTSQPVPVTICGDTVTEGNETFTLTLSNPTNAGLVNGTATGTIVDDDSGGGITPAVSVANAQQLEGSSGTSALPFTVTLNAVSGQPVTVQYATSGGTATAGASCGGNVDYQTASGTLTFGPGETSKTASVTICGDTSDEPSETFTLTLSNPTNATLGTSTATGTIVDDDGQARVGLGAGQGQVTRNEDGSGTLTVQILLTDATGPAPSSGPPGTVRSGGVSPAASGVTVSVSFTTADGTARANVDYVPTSGTVVFDPGETVKTISIPILSPAFNGNGLTIQILLTGATNAIVDPTRSQVTITIPSVPIPTRPEVKENKDDGKAERLTESEQDQREHTSALGHDDLHTEGNVVEVACDAEAPSVTIVNRDGRVTVLLVGTARERCGEVKVGTYLEVSGRKQNEQLFEADEIDVSRIR